MHTVFAKKMLFFNTEPPCKKLECLCEIKKVKVVSKFCNNFNLGLFYSSLVKACSVVAKLIPHKRPQCSFFGTVEIFWTVCVLLDSTVFNFLQCYFTEMKKDTMTVNLCELHQCPNFSGWEKYERNLLVGRNMRKPREPGRSHSSAKLNLRIIGKLILYIISFSQPECQY